MATEYRAHWHHNSTYEEIWADAYNVHTCTGTRSKHLRGAKKNPWNVWNWANAEATTRKCIRTSSEENAGFVPCLYMNAIWLWRWDVLKCITKTTGADETKGANEEQNRVVKRKRIIVDFCMMTWAGTKTRSLIPCDCETWKYEAQRDTKCNRNRENYTYLKSFCSIIRPRLLPCKHSATNSVYYSLWVQRSMCLSDAAATRNSGGERRKTDGRRWVKLVQNNLIVDFIREKLGGNG